MGKEKVKKPFFKRIWVWVVAIILVVGIFGGTGDDEQSVEEASASENSKKESASEDDGEKEKTEEEEESNSNTARVGEPAVVEDVTFTVNEIEETTEISSGNEFIENATTSGKYIIIDVTVKNDKSESITIDSSFFNLSTDEGTTYEPNTDGTVMMAMGDSMDDFFLQQINPGLDKNGKVVFEVGEDISISDTKLHAQTGLFGTESIEILLSN